MVEQRINASVLKPLKDALAKTYWYKSDLKDFLVATIQAGAIVNSIDVSRSKRDFSSDVVMALYEQQHKHFDDLLNLALALADIKDPSWLKDIEDGDLKHTEALKSLATLRKYVEPYRALRTEATEIRARAEQQRKLAERRREHSTALGELRAQFETLQKLDRQRRGYELEKILPSLFMLFDIDARGAFRNPGEQIDGAFSFDGNDYLVEVKWQESLSTLAHVNEFAGKVEVKLDNTLGIFLSINGFQPTAVAKLNGYGRSKVILMDGGDLVAVFQERVTLPVMLTRKRQHAAQTGEVFLSAWNIS